MLPLSGLAILIVEDAYLIALEAQRAVEEAGARSVILARTLEDARAALHSGQRIDVCVLDLMLDHEDASPLLGELAKEGIAVLVASGFDTTNPNLDVPYLRKPYQEGEFIEALRSAVSGRI